MPRIPARTSHRDPGLTVTAKEWCCLYDAANGRLVGRARRAGEIWCPAYDGAVLHPGEVLDTLVAAGLLRPVRRGRWSAPAPPGSC